MTPIALFLVALAVRVAVGLMWSEPAYPDSYYYVNVARALAAGEGFQVDYVWNFVDVGGRVPESAELPIPSNAHWMPLAAMIQVPFLWLLGPTALASALPFWLIGAAAAPLAYLIARDAGLERGIGLTAGLLTAAPAALTPFMAQPDNFGLYMTLGALALWLTGRAWQGDRRALVLAGLVVGLATLARNDGLLLGVPLALAGVAAWRRTAGQARRAQVVATAGSVVLFAAVLGPWLLRQLAVFGSVSPSAAGGRILWLTDYSQLWSVTDAPSLERMLAAGVGPLLASRLDGIVAVGTIVAIGPLALVLVPFALIGAWRLRHSVAFRPLFVYGALLLGVSALLFSVHVRYGMFIHSLVALLPHTFVLVAVGVGVAVDWLAARRHSWRAGLARPVFRGAAVTVALLVGLAQTSVAVRAWQESDAPRRELSAALAEIPTGDRLMAADPGAYSYRYGRAGVVTPNDPLPVIEATARAYGMRWLVLERGGIVPALQPVLLGEQRPAWLSRPLASVEDAAGDSTPLAALYALCLSPADERCAP